MSKLKGNKLTDEVNKCRGECNWDRLHELLVSSISAKGSGMEKQTSLFEGELELERFIEKQKGTMVFEFKVIQELQTESNPITTMKANCAQPKGSLNKLLH
jgi:hypothetical protein